MYVYNAMLSWTLGLALLFSLARPMACLGLSLARQRACLGAVVAVVLSWFSPGALAAQFIAPQNYNVPMADGVVLSTDVWRNVFDDKPHPVLLRRTPYGRVQNVSDVTNLVRAGFTVVSQDVRGRGESGGAFLPFFNDKEDGRATVDWIARQSWSNGNVGTYGASAEGIVQYMTMAAAPDALACAHVSLATPDVYETIFPGGAWRTDLGTTWLTALNAAAVVNTWKAHEVHSDYWAQATLSKLEMAKVDHPVFTVGGFFDVFALSQHNASMALQQNVAPSSRSDVFVVLGPWTHGGLGSKRQGQLLYPDDAAMPTYATDLLQYLSWCLLGAARPPFANVRYYLTELTDDTAVDPGDRQTCMVAKGEWRDDKVWPPAAVHAGSLYLLDEHKLGDSALSADPVALPIDPLSPTPSLGGGNFSTAAGPYDQTSIDGRSDVYTATTEAFAEPTELVGAPHAVIWAASASSDVDVVVRLEVVTPQGKAVLFADGVRRGRFAGGDDAIRPLVPNTPVAFDVELGPIALRLPPGYALRIAIAGQSSPRYEPNPNTAAALSTKPASVKTTLSIYRDPLHPSRIDLPLLSGALPSAPPPVKPAVKDASVTMDSGVPGAPDDAGLVNAHSDATAIAGKLDAAVAHDTPRAMVDGSVTLPLGRVDGCTCRVGRDGPDDRAHDVDASLLTLSGALSCLLLRRRRPRAPAPGKL